MNKTEAIQVLQRIKELYPNHKMSKEKVNLLIPALLPMDYAGVLNQLARHVASSPYAPTISEIAAYPVVENRQLNQLKEWREEACAVPVELKETFRRKMTALLKEKTR